MAYRGPNFYVRFSQTDTPPAGVFDMSDAVSPPTVTFPAVASNTGVGSAAKTVQLIPASTNGGNTTAVVPANTASANNKGWWIPPTTGLAADSTQSRVFPNGTTITYRINVSATAGSGTVTATVRPYGRAPNGTLSAVTSRSATLTLNALQTVTQTLSVSFVLNADVVLGPGETFYYEWYLTIPGQTVAATNVTASFDANSAQSLSSPTGIGYRYLRSHSGSSSVSADRTLTAGVGRAANITLNAVFLRYITKSFSALSVANAALSKNIVPKAKEAFISLAQSDIFKIILVPKVATINVSASKSVLVYVNRVAQIVSVAQFTKFITKNLSATVVTNASITKFLNLSRKFSANVSASARAFVQISQDVLARFSGGSVVKKVINIIFDD